MRDELLDNAAADGSDDNGFGNADRLFVDWMGAKNCSRRDVPTDVDTEGGCETNTVGTCCKDGRIFVSGSDCCIVAGPSDLSRSTGGESDGSSRHKPKRHCIIEVCLANDDEEINSGT